MEKVRVDLDERSYDIIIGAGALDCVGETMRSMALGRQVMVVTNAVVRPLYGDRVETLLAQSGFKVRVVETPDGEVHKSLATAAMLYDALIDFKMDRRCAIVALGGGVIGDVAGFVASTYLRGVPFVSIPTTLLAQVDSAVGGKTGVDHPKGKNLIGAFYQPRLVLCDLDLLRTLPKRELRAGMAEVVKYGVILDANFFSFVESHIEEILNLESVAMAEVVRSSCEAKATVVARDELESGLRAILNFGHTLGHAIEALTGYSQFIHGEAVAIGMVAAARIASAMGVCRERDVQRLTAVLERIGLPTRPPELDVHAVVEAMIHDKKVQDGRIRFILPERIGKVVIRDDVDPALIGTVLRRS